MNIDTEQATPVKLSICISTRNRAHLIGRTLESILSQASAACEVVVLDAASTDETEACVREYTRRFPSLRYIRASKNGGLDADYDRTVELSRGEYCWLASDDDCFKPGAISIMMKTLEEGYSLVVANAGAVASDSLKPLEQTRFDFAVDRTYGPSELDNLFTDTAPALSYIGCVVIKRSVWLERERRRYYGSFFIHLGVIFQKPLPDGAKALVTPLIELTQGNERAFSSRMCEIVCYRLPRLVESLAVSSGAKSMWAKPWTSPSRMLLLRACGAYSLQEYRQWILPHGLAAPERIMPYVVAVLPGRLVNAVLILSYSVFCSRSSSLVWLKNRRI